MRTMRLGSTSRRVGGLTPAGRCGRRRAAVYLALRPAAVAGLALRPAAVAGLAMATLLALVVGLTGCTSGGEASPVPTEEATPTAGVLNIYNWDTYIDPAIITGFEQRYGVTINYNTYGSNEELLANLEAGPTDYDLVVPTDYMVELLRDKELLAPLDSTLLPNMKNLDSTFESPVFDPGNRYCVPYQWGTMGIGYDASIGHEIQGWADMFDPALAGRVSMLSDPRMSMGVILLYLGYSPNTTNLNEIAQARDFLIEHSAQIATYAPDTGQDLLAADEVDVAFEWSGDIFQLMADDPNIRYVIPSEGSLIWTDSMCILATAPHKELAHQFLDYVLEPEVGAALSNYIHFATPNLAARSLLVAADRENPAIYPPPAVRQRLFSLADVGTEAAELYDQAWQQVLAAHPEQEQPGAEPTDEQ